MILYRRRRFINHLLTYLLHGGQGVGYCWNIDHWFPVPAQVPNRPNPDINRRYHNVPTLDTDIRVFC